MAENKKISALGSAAALVGDELISTVQNGVNVSSTPDQIKTFVGAATVKATSEEIDTGTNDTKFATPLALRGSKTGFETIGIACSDTTSDLTTGEKVVFDFPFNFVATRVYASVATAPTGSTITIDVEDEGTSILNAVLPILTSTNNAETSTFAAAASNYALTKDDLVSIDIDQIGSVISGAGLIVFIEGYRT